MRGRLVVPASWSASCGPACVSSGVRQNYASGRSQTEVLEGRQIIAQDNPAEAGAVLGQGPKMNTSVFSKLGWLCQPNFEKREISGGGGLPKDGGLGGLVLG